MPPVSSTSLFRRMCHVVAWVLASGCAAPPVEWPDPAQQFMVGFDTESEVRAAAAGFEADGFEVEAMVFAEDLAAFGVRHPDGRTRVRVATTVGWTLALTAPSAHHTRPWVRLVGLAADVDRNGHDELLVSAQDAVLNVECIAALEWRDGALRESRIDLAAWGATGCIVGVLESAGQPLFVTRLFFFDLSHGRVPSISLLFGRGLEVVTSGTDVSRFYDQQRRSPAADEAANSRAERWAVGVERAALAFALGQPESSQRRIFEQLVDCRQQALDCEAFFETISRAWQAEDPELSLPGLSESTPQNHTPASASYPGEAETDSEPALSVESL